MTIPELLSLDEAQLTVRFYRDVLGAKAYKVKEYGWMLDDSNAKDTNTPLSIMLHQLGFSESEELAWAALPPVSPEVWLAEMDKLPDYNEDVSEIFSADQSGMKRSEFLRRAVMISSVYLSQKGKDE